MLPMSQNRCYADREWVERNGCRAKSGHQLLRLKRRPASWALPQSHFSCQSLFPQSVHGWPKKYSKALRSSRTSAVSISREYSVLGMVTISSITHLNHRHRLWARFSRLRSRACSQKLQKGSVSTLKYRGYHNCRQSIGNTDVKPFPLENIPCLKQPNSL